jgi:hypothetical protein
VCGGSELVNDLTMVDGDESGDDGEEDGNDIIPLWELVENLKSKVRNGRT